MPESDKPEIIWADPSRGLRLEVAQCCEPAFVELLENTRFGSTGLRYRRLDVAGQLAALPAPLFVALRRDERLIGTYVLARMPLQNNGHPVDGVYRALLCVDQAEQGSGLGSLIARHTLAWLDASAASLGKPTLSYGCIERGNLRSLSILRALGASECGRLHTRLLYRQWPRRRVALARLEASDDPRVHGAIAAGQQDCSLRFSKPADTHYYAVINETGIVAGASARLVRLNLDHMGWPWDFLCEHLFNRVGAARRRFDPRRFTYLKLDGLVAAPGSQRVWPDFLASLLAEHGVHMAMIALDPACAISARLADAGLFSRFSRATRQELAVLVSAHNLDKGQLAIQGASPVGLAPVDI